MYLDDRCNDVVIKTLGECNVRPLHPEDEVIAEVRRRYARFREGDTRPGTSLFMSDQAYWSKIRTGVQSPS